MRHSAEVDIVDARDPIDRQLSVDGPPLWCWKYGMLAMIERRHHLFLAQEDDRREALGIPSIFD